MHTQQHLIAYKHLTLDQQWIVSNDLSVGYVVWVMGTNDDIDAYFKDETIGADLIVITSASTELNIDAGTSTIDLSLTRAKVANIKTGHKKHRMCLVDGGESTLILEGHFNLL